MRYFLDLCRGEYGNRVRDDSHVLCAVNAFWSGDGASAGDRVGQPWELGLKREAKEVLTRDGDWDVVYCARRIRSAAGVEGTLRRAWPGPWRLFDAEGVTLVMERASQPSNREMAGAFCTLVPIRPRSRGARRSLRTFPVVTLHPRFPFNV